MKTQSIYALYALMYFFYHPTLFANTVSDTVVTVNKKTPATYSLGVVPQQSAKVLAKLWTPICQYLSSKTGLNIVFSTAKDIPTFERRLLDGKYDIAYMNPYHFTVFNQKPGYQAIAKEQQKKIRGIVVIPKDSNIKDLSGLNGLTLAFPAPAAFAASVLPRAKMRELGIEFTPKYVSSHDSVYLGVTRGFFPAGGGVQRTLNNIPATTKEKLKVLWTTPGYTPHAIAVHPRLSTADTNKIQQAILSMKETALGKKLLFSVKFKDLGAAKNSDWDDVRALNIKLLEHLLME
ncbi:MAG: periplasmic binding protein-related protein [Osedax symbiont Rs2]|nr:MAG: periplasmic binding protein-related protein [Osedax symbiont Rs2]